MNGHYYDTEKECWVCGDRWVDIVNDSCYCSKCGTKRFVNFNKLKEK